MSGLEVPSSPLEPRPGESFFRSRWVDAPEGLEELDPDGLAPGFLSAGSGRRAAGASTDVALMHCDAEPAGLRTAILLTRNASAAAPIVLCRDGLDHGRIRGVVVNSGNANASTGEQGLRDAEAMQAKAAELLGVEADAVAVAETGTIGVPLPIEEVLDGIADCAPRLEAGSARDFTRAIMTTDAFPKRCTIRHGGVTISAQAKGAGMIEPGYATMLCFVQTDGVVDDPEGALRRAVACVVRADHRRRADEHQRHGRPAGDRRGRSAAPGRAARRGAAAARARDRRRRRGREPRRPDRGERRPRRRPRPTASPGRSPTRRSSRRRCSGTTRTGAGSRRPPGMALAGEQIPELGPDVIDASGARGQPRPRPRSRCGSTAAPARAHMFFSDLTHTYIEINAEYTT